MLRKHWLVCLFAVCALGCAQSATKPHAAAASRPAKEAPKPTVAVFEKLVDDVTVAVNDWASAWSKRDLSRYFDAYAPDFTPLRS